MSKKVLVIGDLHCGSIQGLTPPQWQINKGRDSFYSKLQQQMWDNYLKAIDYFGNVDILVVNGDVIDGKGKKSGGTELLTTDMIEQADIAIEAISKIKANKYFFTYGTPYHTTSSGEDFDKIVANAFKAPITATLNLKVENTLFNIKHKVASSNNPYNRLGGIGKQHVWDVLESIRNEDPYASVYIRSHVHYWAFCGGYDWNAFTLPALQASETKYGSRQCYGITDVGMCLFSVDDNTLSGWEFKKFELSSSKKRIMHV